MSDNVVDLSVQFAMNRTAMAVIRRARVVGEFADDIMAIISTLNHNEQRFLTAMIGWRIEGGHALPASDLLTKLPALHGLEFGSIQSTAEGLANADVIEVVPVGQDEKGNVTDVAFIWPALDRLMASADMEKGRAKLIDPNGNLLR